MSFQKQQLKVARDAIAQKNFDYANDLCENILENDPLNYNALVFAGLAQKELQNYEESLIKYRKATQVQPDNTLAYQGMLKLFEEAADLKQQFEVLGSLAGIYFKAKDEQKLAEMLKKRLEISEQFGDREVRLQALSENLPNSPIYQLIKNRDIKSPVDIYKEMLEIHQNSFDEFTKREIQARRTRLGAGTLNEIKLQVEMEGIVDSPIDDLYRKLLNLDLDLQERISLSSQFFKFAKRKILHVNDKRDLREILQNLKEFLLDSNHFTIDVCRMELEENNEKWENLSLDRIKPFFEDIKTEDKALYSMINGYRLMRDENWDEALEEISFGLESDAENIFGNRLLYIAYSHLENWDSTIQSAEFFQKIFVSFQQLYEVSLEIVAKECEFTLACAYANIGETGVTQAITMLKSILNSDPERIDILLKLSQVLLTIPKPTDAIRYLENILAQDCNNDAAICELGWSHYLSNHLESAKECLLRAQGIRETYLTHYRLARVYWSMGGTYRSDKNYAHMNLVEAIKMNPNYSHSFTYLGHFYSSVDSDIERASKCYSKSISINPNDADAVESIVNIWISQDKVKESIDLLHQFAKLNTRSGWAWKQLGILVFSDKNYTESVSYFQADLRINPKDAHSWTLLAEAYTQQGKYIAALKAINKAIEVEPNNITAYFIRGTINTKLNLYSDATADFIFSRDAFFDQSQNLVAVTKSLGESLISEAIELYENGAYGACFENLLKAVSECKLVLKSSQSKNGDILKIIGDACVLIVKLVCNHIDEKLTFPIQETINLLERMYENQLMILELLENHHISWKCKILQCARLCFNLCIVESQQTNLPVLSRLYLDLANVHHLLLLVSDNKSLKDEMFNSAVKFCKQSLAADPENIESWSLMGLLNYKYEPALSQHCFIQALSLDESNANLWCNLGIFYLLNEDIDLAQQCFKKSQLADPDLALGWFGLGIVNEILGTGEHFKYFEHANEISKSVCVEMMYYFSNQCFLQLDDNYNQSSLEAALFTLQKCSELRDQTVALNNLFGLFLEKQNRYDFAIAAFEKALLYVSESDILDKAVIFENYARCLCSMGRFAESIENFRHCLKDRGDAYTWASYGLSLYFNEMYDESLNAFEKALELSTESDNKNLSNNIRYSLSQVLYALGGEDHIEVAKQQLLKCFADNPDFVKAIISLCAIGLVLEDWTLAETAAAELLKLDPRILKEFDEDVDLLLCRMFTLTNNRIVSRGFFAKSIHKYPWKANLWSRLAEYEYMYGSTAASISLANCSLQVAKQYSSESTHTAADLISKIYRTCGLSQLSAGNTSDRNISRAIFLNPSDPLNWMAASLNLAVSKEIEFMQLAKCSTEAAKKVALDLDEKNWAKLLFWNHSFELSKFCSDQNFSNYLEEVDFLASNASFLISNQAYVLLGNILYSMNEAAMCLQISRQAVKTIPYFMSNVAIYPFLELAKKYELNNYPEAAVKCLEKAVSCFPSNAIARMILCILYLRTDNPHSCEKYIDELIKEKTGGNIVRIIQTAILLNEGDGISLKKAKKNMAFLEHQSISQAEMNFLCSLEK